MGRHGGINILHQKSWHVWRMDNRLRVERDELQHGAEQKGRKKGERQAAFDGKMLTLRHRAAGTEPSEAELQQVQLNQANTAEAAAAGSGSHKKSKKGEGEDEYSKFGVSLSNLQLAEAHLDRSLGRGKNEAPLKKSQKGQGKGGPPPPEKGLAAGGSGGLGSGPHMNLFEEAEQAMETHLAAHGKLLRYAETNNSLVDPKAKQAPLSEFDEIANLKPWYMASAAASAEKEVDKSRELLEISGGALGLQPPLAIGGPEFFGCMPQSNSRSRSRSVNRFRRKWTESHGQTILRVKPAKQEKKELTAKKEKKELTAKEEKQASHSEKQELTAVEDSKEGGAVIGVQELGGSSPVLLDLCEDEDEDEQANAKAKKDKKDKKDKKEKKDKKHKANKDKRGSREHERKERLERERAELMELRQQREERERLERCRAAPLLGRAIPLCVT
ncbi:unnamed protein product [Polarella glacialis]|uniref:CBF1-interacting co-repressor CIR N-terminal domain-containing protein n=1 Tax=Polarella glacialis TaxID=89957 RepID=A0A813JBC2_POLGL|nr:unnamed protein product [Polarella glacialis]